MADLPKFLPLSRRSMMAATSAGLLVPCAARAEVPTDPDVIVIGAGAAGIGAARKLMAEGKSFVVLEAADRTGGRAWAESKTFGVPFDSQVVQKMEAHDRVVGSASLTVFLFRRMTGFRLWRCSDFVLDVVFRVFRVVRYKLFGDQFLSEITQANRHCS